LAGAETEEIVGAVWSIVTVVAAVLLLGPVCDEELVIALDARVRITVPGLHPERDME
jgi:hypothetical protein